MRENTKWIMLVTALAFVALMVFEWGMDITGQSAGGMGQIGRVNGSPVMYEDYMASYRSIYDRVQDSQETPVTSQQNKEIEDAAWNEVVNRILIQQELERRGIRVTDEEIRSAARFNPPPEFRQVALFQTDGQFDLQKYQDFLASPQADDQTLLYLEAYYRDVIPRGKLMRQVSTGIYLTDKELWQRWQDQNETIEVRYIPLNPAERIDDGLVEVTDREIEEYYETHQEEFEVPARATVKAVVIDKTPTPADSAASAERADQIAQELRDGADFAELARLESADEATAEAGGDLGVFTPGQMVPEFDSVAFSAEVGEIAGPVTSSFGHHILRVEERWGQDSVQARHILVPIARTDDSEIAMLTLADSLEDLGEDRPLAEAAELTGLELQEAQLNEDFAFVTGAGQVGEGMDWALEEASPGDVSPVFENSEAFYALELVSSTPGGILPLEEARASIESTLRSRKKTARAVDEGEELVSRIRSGTPFATVADEAGLEVREAGPFARNDFVPGLGRRNAAIGTAFGLDVGEVSDPVATPANVFILEKLNHIPADSTQWLEQKAAQRQQVQQQQEQQRLQLWLESLRAEASIQDRREEVLTPADEEAPARPMGGFGF